MTGLGFLVTFSTTITFFYVKIVFFKANPVNNNLYCKNHCNSTYHVVWVNEGVVDGHDLDAFLNASPQDQAANAPKAGTGRKMKSSHCRRMIGNILRKSNWPSDLTLTWNVTLL